MWSVLLPTLRMPYGSGFNEAANAAETWVVSPIGIPRREYDLDGVSGRNRHGCRQSIVGNSGEV